MLRFGMEEKPSRRHKVIVLGSVFFDSDSVSHTLNVWRWDVVPVSEIAWDSNTFSCQYQCWFCHMGQAFDHSNSDDVVSCCNVNMSLLFCCSVDVSNPHAANIWRGCVFLRRMVIDEEDGCYIPAASSSWSAGPQKRHYTKDVFHRFPLRLKRRKHMAQALPLEVDMSTLLASISAKLSMLLYVTLELGVSIYGCFLKWWYPQNTPKWSFLVGKPMVVGYHHFRKPPYVTVTSHEMFFGWDPDTRQQEL